MKLGLAPTHWLALAFDWQFRLRYLILTRTFLFPFTNVKKEGGEVIIGSTVTPSCFPQATGSAFPLLLSDWEIRSNCQHGS